MLGSLCYYDVVYHDCMWSGTCCIQLVQQQPATGSAEAATAAAATTAIAIGPELPAAPELGGDRHEHLDLNPYHNHHHHQLEPTEVQQQLPQLDLQQSYQQQQLPAQEQQQEQQQTIRPTLLKPASSTTTTATKSVISLTPKLISSTTNRLAGATSTRSSSSASKSATGHSSTTSASARSVGHSASKLNGGGHSTSRTNGGSSTAAAADNKKLRHREVEKNRHRQLQAMVKRLSERIPGRIDKETQVQTMKRAAKYCIYLRDVLTHGQHLGKDKLERLYLRSCENVDLMMARDELQGGYATTGSQTPLSPDGRR